MIEFAPFRLDARAGRLWRGNRPVPLRPKAWKLLGYLAARPGVLVPKEELLAAIWGDAVVSDETLTRTLAELRQALGDSARTPRIIETVHRRGVRFIGLTRSIDSGAAAPALSGEPNARPESLLVGRDPEIARLLALFHLAGKGQRQVVFALGEPGLGKSALVNAFLQAVRELPEPALVGYGQCVEQHGEREPYMAVFEILERLSQGAPATRLHSLLRSIAPSWLAQIPQLQSPTDAEQMRRWHTDTTPHRMLREFAGLVEALSASHPLILVIEDLHWSDRGTVDLLSVLAQRPERARLMVVGTYRPAEALALDHPIQQVLITLRARNRCSDIALTYLGKSDVGAYLRRRLAAGRVAEDVVGFVHARTDGNPLFMVVLVDHLLARGWLAEGNGVWRLTAKPATVEHDVPDNIRQLLEGQLRLASPEERAVLEVAGVAGVAFDVPAVAAALGNAVGDVEAVCHRLGREGRWLHYRGHREWPDGSAATRYAFQHWLYHRALYDRLPPGRRAVLHQQIGRRIEAGFAGRTAEASRELARHFEGGGDLRRAVTYLEQAALRAYDRRALLDVVACLEPALTMLERLPDTPERGRDELRLRRLYSVVLSQIEGFASETLRANLDRVGQLCEQFGDSAAHFDVLSALLLLHANHDFGLAREIGLRAERLAEGLDASAALQSDFLQGALVLWSGDLKAAETFLGRALSSPTTLDEADRPYGVNPLIAARSHESLRRWITGDTGGALALMREGLALAEQHGRPFTIANATTFCSFLLTLDGSWEEAVRLAGRTVELSEEFGFPRWLGAGLVVRGRGLIEGSDPPRGRDEVHEGVDIVRRAGLGFAASLLLSFAAAAHLRLDHLEKARAAADAGIRHCRETGEHLFEAELWRLRGEIALRAEHVRSATAIREAEECFTRARAVARAQGAHWLERRVDAGERGPVRRRRASS